MADEKRLDEHDFVVDFEEGFFVFVVLVIVLLVFFVFGLLGLLLLFFLFFGSEIVLFVLDFPFLFVVFLIKSIDELIIGIFLCLFFVGLFFVFFAARVVGIFKLELGVLDFFEASKHGHGEVADEEKEEDDLESEGKVVELAVEEDGFGVLGLQALRCRFE